MLDLQPFFDVLDDLGMELSAELQSKKMQVYSLIDVQKAIPFYDPQKLAKLETQNAQDGFASLLMGFLQKADNSNFMRIFNQFLEYITNNKVQNPSPKPFLLKMKMLSKMKRFKEVMAVMREEMPKYGCSPDDETLSYALDFLGARKELDAMEQLFEDMASGKYMKPTINHYNIMLKYVRFNPQRVQNLQQLKEKNNIETNAITLKHIIEVLEPADSLRALVEHMIDNNISPTIDIVNTLLNKFASMCSPYTLIRCVENSKLMPNVWTHQPIVKAFVFQDDFQGLFKYLADDASKPFTKPHISTVSTVIETIRNRIKNENMTPRQASSFIEFAEAAYHMCEPSPWMTSWMIEIYDMADNWKALQKLYNNATLKVDNYNTLLVIFLRRSMFHLAEDVYSHMVSSDQVVCASGLAQMAVIFGQQQNIDKLVGLFHYAKQIGIFPLRVDLPKILRPWMDACDIPALIRILEASEYRGPILRFIAGRVKKEHEQLWNDFLNKHHIQIPEQLASTPTEM